MAYYIHTYKTELELKKVQCHQAASACGTCRFVYNLYLEKAREAYQAAVIKIEPDYFERVEEVKAFNKGKPKKQRKAYPKAPKTGLRLTEPKVFYSWLKKEYIPQNPGKEWINETSSQSILEAIKDAYRAYQNFFKGKAGYPKFKTRKRSNHSCYFVRVNADQPIISGRHFVQVPGYGKYHLKEKGYIPTSKEGEVWLSSGRITEKNGHFYISVTVRFLKHKPQPVILSEEGEGVDLGVKTLATLSDGTKYRNINKDKSMKRKAKHLRQQQKAQSRKYEAWKQQKEMIEIFNENIKEINACLPKDEQLPLIEPVPQSKNLKKNISRVGRLHESLAGTRRDYNRKVASDIISRKPKYLTMEDLNVKAMMKNKHLSKAIGDCCFGELQTILKALCFRNGIEFRLANRYFPSSKLCSHCHAKKNDLKLSERSWTCPVCGHKHDRDQNAAINLKETNQYTVVPRSGKDAKNIYI